MIKKLLSVASFAFIALSVQAFELDQLVYTKNAKYQITGANLVTNGQFKDGTTGMDGWTAISADAALEQTFMRVENAEGSDKVVVQAGMNAMANGMYQTVKVPAGGYYVVSFKVLGAAAGYTDLDMKSAGDSYMNAYYNTDGVLAAVDGNGVGIYGENGVEGGYEFSFGPDGVTEVVFALEAPAEGNIIIDFRGLAEGLEISDVKCHAAEPVYDDRVARNRIAYFQKYLGVESIATGENYEMFVYCVEEVETALANNASAEEMATLMENVEAMWAEVVNEKFSNVLNSVMTTDGSSNTGNNSANWMNWTGHYNKLSAEYNGKAPWTWSTDRWGHKNKEGYTDMPMGIQWQAGIAGPYDNIATLTTTLKPGTYFWGVSGSGGMMSKNKGHWKRSWAKEVAGTQLFFNDETTDVFLLDPAVDNDYVYQYTLTEEKEVTLGIICNTTTEHTYGFDVKFYSPVLYMVLVEGQLTPEQEAYLAAVELQLEALKGRLDVANGYLAADQVLLPWGKEDLQVGVTEAQARYDAWTALSQEEILAMMDNYETLADTIMNKGVRFLNNNYINIFTAKNTPLTNMPTAVEAAEAVLAQRIYGSSTKKADLESAIAASEAMYNDKLKAPFSVEDSTALVDQKVALEAMVEEFKLAIVANAVIDIDFGTQEAPAVFVTHEDPEQLVETYYTIDGAKGTMNFTDITGSYCYGLGWGSATDAVTGAVVLTDSLGMLRVGNSEAVVEIKDALAKESDIVNIQFDLFVGNLNKCKAGYKVLTAAGDTICGLYFSKYSGVDDLNTFAVDYNANIAGVGSSSASNSAIAASSNCTHFDIVLDYGARVMYCTTSGSRGTVTSEEILFETEAPGQFVLYSNYSNADRRCWFDNLKVYNIPAEPTTGIEETEVVAPVRPTNGIMYNILGQPISNPVKGQLYIQDGQKKIAK